MQPSDPSQARPGTSQQHPQQAGPGPGAADPAPAHAAQPPPEAPGNGHPEPAQTPSGGWPTHGQAPPAGPGRAPGFAPGTAPTSPPAGHPTGIPPQASAPYARVPGPGWAPEHRISLGDGLSALGGLLMFLFSFAPFLTYDDDRLVNRLKDDHLPSWFSAWSTETFMAPLTWFVVLAGLIAISLSVSHLAIARDREVTGFRTSHLQIGVTLFAFLVLFGYATSAKRVLFGHDLSVLFGDDSNLDTAMSFGWGGWLMLLGALVALVGAVIGHLELGPTLYPQPPRQPQPAQPAQPHQHPGQPGQQPPAQQHPVPPGQQPGGHLPPPPPPPNAADHAPTAAYPTVGVQQPAPPAQQQPSPPPHRGAQGHATDNWPGPQ